MDTRTFAATLLKVAGLVICVYTFTKIPAYLPPALANDLRLDTSVRVLIAAMDLVPPFILGLLLWFFPGRVANKIIIGEDKTSPVVASEIERVAITVLGLYVVVYGISDLAYQAGVLLRLNENRAAVIPGAVSDIVQIVVGLVLVFGARRLINAVRG